MVKESVEQLKGTVQLSSEVGKGTVIRVDLPSLETS
jgi:chemotaxis protein histidine kinase CheA